MAEVEIAKHLWLQASEEALMPVVEIVAAGAAAASALSSIIPQLNGSRSVILEIDNKTGGPLTRIGDHLEHGGFAVTPSSDIPPQMADVFGAQNSGGSIATGTEGTLSYRAPGVADITISWVNPFIGGNESSATVSGGHLARLRVVTTTGAGNVHAHMRYEVFDRAQSAWRFCHKCIELFFDGSPEKGVCPRGGGHEAAGFEFVLPHDTPEPGQDQWRFCHKCMAMFFNAFPDKGICARGGGHEAAGFNFVLPHDTPGPGQDQWRFCQKCASMFFDGFPDKGICQRGGGHEAAGFTFRLPHLA